MHGHEAYIGHRIAHAEGVGDGEGHGEGAGGVELDQAGVLDAGIGDAGTGAEAPEIAQRQVAVGVGGGGGKVEGVADVDDQVGGRGVDAAVRRLVADGDGAHSRRWVDLAEGVSDSEADGEDAFGVELDQAGVLDAGIGDAGTGAEVPEIAQRQVAVGVGGGGGKVEGAADADDQVGGRGVDGGVRRLVQRRGVAEQVELAHGGQRTAVVCGEADEAHVGGLCRGEQDVLLGAGVEEGAVGDRAAPVDAVEADVERVLADIGVGGILARQVAEAADLVDAAETDLELVWQRVCGVVLGVPQGHGIAVKGFFTAVAGMFAVGIDQAPA